MQVAAVATLADVLRHLESHDDPALRQHTAPVRACRERYGYEGPLRGCGAVAMSRVRLYDQASDAGQRSLDRPGLHFQLRL